MKHGVVRIEQRVVSDAPKIRSKWRQELGPFHELLADRGIAHGLIGPREGPRLWDRHLDNCAVVALPDVEVVPTGAHIADLGSGAGLPGLVWAITRPDLQVTLIEPLLRRTEFLQSAVDQLGLGDRVRIVRGRAQDVPPIGADVVTSRALTALPTLIDWSLPHVTPGGTIAAIKGGRASEELSEARAKIRRSEIFDSAVLELFLSEPDEYHTSNTFQEPSARVVLLQPSKGARR